MASIPAATNLLLRAVPDSEYQSFCDVLEYVELPRGQVLIEPDTNFPYVYFPARSVASSLTLLVSGSTVEAATIGNEGMCGLSAFLGGTESTQHIIQIADGAWRMKVGDLRSVAAAMPVFNGILRRYTNAYMGQLSQSSACNAVHVTEVRCARWLLATDDRTGTTGSFSLTQDFLANMLGVHRPTVTIAAGMLQNAGLIRYRRGQVEIMDRSGLEDAACECYAVAARRFASVFEAYPYQRE